jgi:hypothetical protein
MARKEHQAVLEDGYRALRRGGAPRKITTTRLWVTRVLYLPPALTTVFVAVAAVAAGEALLAIVAVGVGFVGFAFWRFLLLLALSTPAPELPDESAGTGVTSLPTVDTAEARQLKSAGYGTVEGIALAEYDELAASTPFAADRVERIHTAAREQIGDPETARGRLRGDAPGQGRTSEDRPR